MTVKELRALLGDFDQTLNVMLLAHRPFRLAPVNSEQVRMEYAPTEGDTIVIIEEE